MTTAAIETQHLRKEFGPKTAVADLTLTVQAGEILGFLGPNGAGKTTSIKMLLGLVRPTAGEARLLGAPLGERRTRARVGFLPEHFRFQDWLTAREFLSFHGRLYGVPRAELSGRIERLLARVDLVDAANRKLREYSKGMLQRVGLAQALLNEPKLVFLDEPTSGLDPLGRLLVRDIMHDLRAQGTAVFLNSHLLSEVEITCDRVVFVKQGRVVREMTMVDGGAQGEALEVELKLGTYAPELLGGLAQFGHDVRQGPELLSLRVADEARVPELARWLVGQGVDVYRLATHKRSLEALFLEVMGEDGRPG